MLSKKERLSMELYWKDEIPMEWFHGVRIEGGMLMGCGIVLFFGPVRERRKQGKMNLTHIPVIAFSFVFIVKAATYLLSR